MYYPETEYILACKALHRNFGQEGVDWTLSLIDLHAYEDQHYWEDANTDNIDEIVRNHFEAFIKSR
jgi:hypothetical protein